MKVSISLVAVLMALSASGALAADNDKRTHDGQMQLSGFGYYDNIGLTDTREWAAGGGLGYFLTDLIQVGVEGSIYHNELSYGYEANSDGSVPKAAYYPGYTPPSSSSSSSSSDGQTAATPTQPAETSYTTYKAMYWHGDAYVTIVMPTSKSNPLEPYAGILAGVYYDDYNRDYDFLAGAKAGLNVYISEPAGFLTEYRYMRNTEASENEHYVLVGLFYNL